MAKARNSTLEKPYRHFLNQVYAMVYLQVSAIFFMLYKEKYAVSRICQYVWPHCIAKTRTQTPR
jgi:hypothetical protein